MYLQTAINFRVPDSSVFLILHKELAPEDGAYYDRGIVIDLSKVEPMIAMPFHPSNTYTIEELNANLLDILDDVEKKESELEMLEQLVSLTGITQHKGLQDLDKKPVRHNVVCEKEQISATVQKTFIRRKLANTFYMEVVVL